MQPNTKRYVDHYLQVYANILQDVLYAYPAMKEELRKDAERLSTLASDRGLHLFMVDLPGLGKHLDRCLSTGQYKLSGLAGSRRFSGRVVIPKLFRGLYLLVFDELGTLKENVDAQALFLLRQLLCCAKKAQYPCSDQATAKEIQAFLDIDDQLPIPEPWWANPEAPFPYTGFAAMYGMPASGLLPEAELPSQGGGPNGPSDQSLLTRLDTIVGFVSTALGPFNPEEWNFKHGPGVVSDVDRGENRYRFELWPDLLETAFPIADFAYHSYCSWADDTQNRREYEIIPHSRLIAVPKTLVKPRLIAAEPSAHMWCQQNIWHYFRSRVRETWVGLFVKFTDQSQNQELCVRGSLDGSLATIDLSAASDRVSCRCVGNMFRANRPLLEALRATRTRHCSIPGRDEDGLVELRKYSTMGNATTFPVESLIFLSVALACCADWDRLVRYKDPLTRARVLLGMVTELHGKVSIFGDDIIVPTEFAGNVKRLLTLIGFKVNDDKSFTVGQFRESCGVDAFRGIEVTPVYVSSLFDGSPESYAACIDMSNNLYKRFLVCTSEYLRRQLRGKIRFPMVPFDSGLTGFTSFVRPLPLGFPIRWDEGLQEEQIRVPVFHNRSELSPLCDDTALLQFLTKELSPFQPRTVGIRSRPVLRIRHRWVSCTQYPLLKGRNTR